MEGSFDIAIVGGGMVGASLAVALQPLGLRVGLVESFAFESAAQPAYDDRSVALSWGSSLILRAMGLERVLQQGAEPIRSIHVSDRGHFGATRLQAVQEGVPALGYVVESRVLGQALHARLAGSALQLFQPASVTGLQQQADQVALTVEQQEKTLELQTRLLVVADGARSQLRGWLGIGVEERDYHQTAVIANVTTELPHRQTAYERFTPEGPLALLPMTRERYSLVWTRRREQVDALSGRDDAAFLAGLQQAFGFRQGQFLHVGQRSTFPLMLLKSAHEYAGRALLIGNASHALHPVAGQGLNLALRDVAVLADLLAAEAAAAAPDCGRRELLQAYARERRPDHASVVGYTDSLVRLFSAGIPLLGHARAAGLLAVDRVAPLRHLLMRQSMGLRFRKARLARGLGLRA